MSICLIAPGGEGREALVRELSARDPAELPVFASVDEFRQGWGRDHGVVLLSHALPAAQVLTAAELLAHRGEGWVAVVVRPGRDGGFQAIPLSFGWWGPLEEVVEQALDPQGDRPLLDLRVVLKAVARFRHDLNNPLTAALAETQLLLMDDLGPEAEESLELIQTQLRRLRDMVAAMTCLRPPRLR